MNRIHIDQIAGMVVFLSTIPLLIRVLTGRVRLNLTSWANWCFLLLALLVAYRNTGLQASLWAATGSFAGVSLATIASLGNGYISPPTISQVLSCILGAAALGVIWFWKGFPFPPSYPLYIAILADAIVAIPSIISFWHNSKNYRPFPSLFLGLGYGISIFAIEHKTILDYFLPTYMAFYGFMAALPGIVYKSQARSRIVEWI